MEFLVEYGSLGVIVVGLFWWFQALAIANRRKAQKACDEISRHKDECGQRYEASASSDAEIRTTLGQVASTVDKIDRRTQLTHDDVTILKAKAE